MRFLLSVSLLLASPLLHAIDWPQEVTADEGTIVVYQPQPDRLAGNVLTGRAAISLELKDKEDPIFGTMWFESRIETDQDTDTAMVLDLKVTKVAWPDSKDAGERRFTTIVEGAMPDAGFQISLSQLSASLKTADVERKSLKDLKTDPPAILFRQSLSVLLLYDGDPRFSPVDDSDYERAMNTPFVVARDTRTRQVYLTDGTFWYQADSALGPFHPISDAPADLVKMMPKPSSDDEKNAPKSPPAIVVATKPTELIVTQGKPAWQSLPGGQVLYVQNTETAWLRELSTNDMYVLLSGRWYRATSQKGPWTFVRSDELPASFSDIPPASDIGGVRVSVSGTDEADQAVEEASIPQTAAIKRSEATLTVQYDGKPKFEKIAGTEVSYAVNTGSQVLEIKGRYYAVDNGVWFTSASATGPWVVADSVPESEIAQIPPSSPVYNTTYVHVYQSTPDVVYVGYTPGYLWSFPYYGVPVYGTGWYYPPYWGGGVFYPRAPTWGLHVGYNPWTGWNFGVSWSNGFFSMGVSWGGGWHGPYRPWGCCGGWYGGGYRAPVLINTGNVNIGNRATIKNRIGDNSVDLNRIQKNNLYNRPENIRRNAEPAVARQNLKQARPVSDRANNVYSDRQGQVARRTDDGWQTRSNGQWQSVQDKAADAGIQRDSLDRGNLDTGNLRNQAGSGNLGSFDRSGFDQAFQNRQMGALRERGSFGGGGFGGGFRRR